VIRVPIHLGFWCRRQPHQQRIEIIENRGVFLVDRPVRFIDNHHIEVADAEFPQTIRRFINEAHHRRIGGDKYAAFSIPLRHQVHRSRCRQVCLERVHSLIHQRHAIGQKHALNPVQAHQQIAQRNHSSSLTRSRRHHQQRAAIAIFLECLSDPANRARLIVPLDDLRIDRAACQVLPRLPPLDQQLQLVFLIEPLDLSRRIVRVVPDPVFVAVGIKDHRTLAELALQAIRIELGLLLSGRGAPARALGLDNPQRLAVVSPTTRNLPRGSSSALARA
jgi:hypothetical protein